MSPLLLGLGLALSAGAQDPGHSDGHASSHGHEVVDGAVLADASAKAEAEARASSTGGEQRVEITFDASEDGIDATVTLDGVDVQTLDPGSGDGRAHVFERTAVERINALEARLAEMEAELARAEREVQEAEDALSGDGSPKDRISSSGGVTVASDEVVLDAVSLAGPVSVHGVVRGDAVSMGGGIVVHDGARVHGDAVAFGGPVEVRPGGRVDGDRVAMDGGPSMSAVMGPVAELSNGWMAALESLLRRIAMVLSIAGAGVLIVGIWPRQVDQVAEMVRARPFWTSIAGGILVGAFSVGALALTFTFVGIPLALLLLGVLALAAMLGFVAVCQALGEGIPQLRRHGSWATFLAGAALLGLVSLMPWVGPVSLALVGFSAVGAALVTRLGNAMVVEPG